MEIAAENPPETPPAPPAAQNRVVRRRRPRRTQIPFTRPEVFDEALVGLIGQADLRRKLVSAFSQYTGFLHEAANDRPVVLVYGPSGSGKTYAIKQLCDRVQMPVTKASSASISPPSFKGLTMRDILIRHWQRWHTSEGVIYLDEIDKWTSGAAGEDAETKSMGIRCQAEILTYLEDEQATFVDEARDDSDLEGMVFDTRRTFWILSGAFVGLDKYIKERLWNIQYPKEEVWIHATPPDFIRYGCIDELANRVNTWAWVKPLTQMEIVTILRQQEKPKWERRFALLGCELDLQEGALGAVTVSAYQQRTGARGAMAMLRRSLDDIYTEASRHNLKQVAVDAAVVSSGRLDIPAESA